MLEHGTISQLLQQTPHCTKTPSPKSENTRIIYENDEIGVAHYFISFKDGTRQAVLVAYTIKDGKIIRSETGATNMPKK